jgi:hypothetical protein
MQTISITSIETINGDRLYRAAMGDRQSTGKTAGKALDALTIQMGSTKIQGFLFLPSDQPDKFFTAEQQRRLAELMSVWRDARDRGASLPDEQQAELDTLIEAELYATADQAKYLF